MKQVKAGSTLDSITRSKMKRRLIEARKELSRLAKLAEIARPASMPPVTRSVDSQRLIAPVKVQDSLLPLRRSQLSFHV